jgi:hypothetical protein
MKTNLSISVLCFLTDFEKEKLNAEVQAGFWASGFGGGNDVFRLQLRSN